MIGAKALTDARLNGWKAEQVFVTVLSRQPTDGEMAGAEDALQNGHCAEIIVTPDDHINRLDLRVLHGLVAHVQGIDNDRVMQVANRIKKFHPAQTICSTETLFEIIEGVTA